MNKFQLKKLKFKKDLAKTQEVKVNNINQALYNNQNANNNSNNKEENLKKKKKQKKDKVAKIITIIVAIFCGCFLAGIIAICLLLVGKPRMNINDFISPESSIVYDRNGDIISELGQTIRKNVTYDELPTSLIDAFVAVEDSRFFEHNGFDIPRFAKAIIENLKTFSFGQGGSTFTMQLVKNTYFVDDDAGVGAAKSIKRKVQEIALAIELENNPSVSKKDIFVAYLNKLYFGGTYQNIRGVQKAAEYYFGKEVKELTLPESAMLAGVINAPNLYNPYNYLEYAQDRRDEVLYLMLHHGYISKEEYDIAIATKVENFLTQDTSSNKGIGEGIPYQAYIDQVVDEVYELTGLDPYSVSMKIYTAMDKNIQEKIDEIQSEIVDETYYRTDANGEKYFYPDDKFETASICVDNTTGEIYGILGGRNYSKGGALLLNHATQQKKQPGSSIKPILDYSQAFEVLGWSTSHIVTDRPITYPGTSILIGNSNGYYQGDLPLKHAVFESLNTPAILTLQEIIENENGGNKYLSNYMNSIGFDVDPEDFNVQYAIGGGNLEVTPLQMAGAQATLINLGKYNKPHTITKIEFMNEKPPFIYESETKQVLSPEAAYLTTELLKFNVSGDVTKDDGSHYANLMELFQDKYQVYAKTGTTNWDSTASNYGIPNGSIKDGWVIASTSKVTIATWIGYEKAEKTDDIVYGYIPYSVYNRNLKGKITKMLLNESIESFGIPSPIESPENIQSISHITIAGKPYIAPIEGMPEEYIANGLIKKSAYSLTDAQTVGIEQMTGAVNINYSNGLIQVQMPSYPILSSTASADHTYDISLYNSDGNLLFFSEPIYGKKSFDYSWLYGSIKYKVDLKVNGNIIKSESFDTNNVSIDINNELTNGQIVDGNEIKVTCYYGFDSLDLNSNKVDSNSYTISDQITFTILKENYSNLQQQLANLNPSIGTPVSNTPQQAMSGYQNGDIMWLTLKDGTQYTPDPNHSITIPRSKLSGAVITYYTAPIVTINLTSSQPELSLSDGQPAEFTITAQIFNYLPQITDLDSWTITKDGEPYSDAIIGEPQIDDETNTIKILIKISEIGQYVIKGTLSTASSTATVKVTN